MAKTTTRPKPATSKKTVAAGSATPDGAADIRMIPLDQLEPSPLNVRKVAASVRDDAELLASIRETGIKQNLVVHALSETRFAVDAGGRCLKALKQLGEDGVIPANHPVPCLVEDERNAILTSATENLQRAAMHPADQFEAFDKMIAEGRSEDEIALKFGVSVDLVRSRLKLARVAPEIIEQFRAGDLTLECVMASDTSARQDNILTHSFFKFWSLSLSIGPPNVKETGPLVLDYFLHEPFFSPMTGSDSTTPSCHTQPSTSDRPTMHCSTQNETKRRHEINTITS